MRFDVLGRLTVTGRSGEIPIRGTKRRLLLATLLARVNHEVSVDVMVESLWGRPPESAPSLLRWHVHQLRRTLGEPDRITFHPNGYRLHAAPDEVDWLRFERDVAAAPDDPDPARLFARALEGWHGRAFEGFADRDPVRDVANRLDRLRLDTIERYLELRLVAGEHDTLVPELTTLVEQHPFREGFTAGLMLALYRSGRSEDALAVFSRAKDRLAAELGIDPGPRLRDLAESITDRASGLVPVRAGPAELPPRRPGLTGRDTELNRLCELLRHNSPVRRVVAVNGIGGIGKSTLAIEAAHAVGDRFPDGRMYVDLHGATPDVKPRQPEEVLARFLRSLGDRESSGITDVDELAARFRTVTADRRILVVLDDARDAAQVRPLLPSGPDCAVLITSRADMSMLDDSAGLGLAGLSRVSAEALLRHVLGDGRVDADPDGTAALIEHCAGLPLALTICTARLAARPNWTITDLARRLARRHHRLSELAIEDLTVRACFDVSYRDLTELPDGARAAYLFRLLGVHDGPDIDLPAAAALGGVDLDTAEDLLDVLCRARLVNEHAPGRYRSHDLLRCYAKELVEAEETEPGRRAAYIRLLHHYCATARACIARVAPAQRGHLAHGPDLDGHPVHGIEDADTAVEWVRAELANVIAVCAACPPDPEPVGAVMSTVFAIGRIADDVHNAGELLELRRVAVDRADATGVPWLRGPAYAQLGIVHQRLNDLVSARRWLERALDVLADCPGHPVSAPLTGLSIVLTKLGERDAAADVTVRALAAARAEGNAINELVALSRLGRHRQFGGDHPAALEFFGEAIDRARAIGDSNEVPIWYYIGLVRAAQHRTADAIEAFRTGIDRAAEHRVTGTGQHAQLLWGLADAEYSTGEADAARRHWDESAGIVHRLNLITGERLDAIRDVTPPAKPSVLD